MKKLSKIKLQNVVVLNAKEMKTINGGTIEVMTSCGSGTITVGPDYFEDAIEFFQYLQELNEIFCGESGIVEYWSDGSGMEFNF